MPNTPQPNEDQDATNQEKARFQVRWWWIATGTVILLVGLGFVSYGLGVSSQISFITVNALSILVLAAIASQALIYHRQREVMERQWQVMDETLKETRRIFDMTERPIIIAWNASLPGFDAGYVAGTRVRPTVNFHNKGRTAAQKIKVTTEVAANPSHVYPWGPPKTDVQPQGDYFLGGNDTMSIEAAPAHAVAFEADFAKRILDGKEFLLIHGNGSYEDMAGREWPIEYSFQYRTGRQEGSPGGFVQHIHPKISNEKEKAAEN